MTHQQELTIKIILDAWNNQVSRADKFFDIFSDEQLQQEMAPGRNTGLYMLGHLTAVHDALFPLLDLGEKMYPALEEVFLKNPDKSGIDKPTVKDVRSYWSEVKNKLDQRISQVTNEEWFYKHTSISDEDFEKEPHRNKLNVLMTRTTHLAYHLGQLAFLKK
ncbi:MAG: DinB family protein [Ginsengibacter sp.]